MKFALFALIAVAYAAEEEKKEEKKDEAKRGTAKAGEKCDAKAADSGCIEGHQCGTIVGDWDKLPAAVLKVFPVKKGDQACAPEADCGKDMCDGKCGDGISLSVECGAKALAASAVAALAAVSMM